MSSNAATIKENQRKRLLFLKTIYEATRGDCQVMVNIWEIGDELGFSKEETNLIDDYLANQSLIKHVTFGGNISMTPTGVVYTESVLLDLEKDSKNSISVGGNVANSNVVLGNSNIIINIEQPSRKQEGDEP